MLSLLGLVSWALAAIDVAVQLLGVSFTGVAWSPILFLTLGLVFFTLEALPKVDGGP
jgi:hypothetical protein